MARAITRWDPMAEFADMRARLDRMFGDTPDGGEQRWMPAIDMTRENGTIKLRVDVPGIKPQEMKIEVEDDTLSISGEHEESHEEQEKEYIRRERRTGSFLRTVSLPKGVDPAQIQAETRDGVLEVTVPMPAQDAGKRVSITPRSAS